jgi:hypothetical protein
MQYVFFCNEVDEFRTQPARRVLHQYRKDKTAESMRVGGFIKNQVHR